MPAQRDQRLAGGLIKSDIEIQSQCSTSLCGSPTDCQDFGVLKARPEFKSLNRSPELLFYHYGYAINRQADRGFRRAERLPPLENLCLNTEVRT